MPIANWFRARAGSERSVRGGAVLFGPYERCNAYQKDYHHQRDDVGIGMGSHGKPGRVETLACTVV